MLALAPGLVGALVLGELHSRSALGEPFTGRIELPDITPDELSTLKVRLASQAEFDRADTVRPRFLTELEFEPRTSPEGRAMIQVTSRQPIREPFLDFLIEVRWSQGRLIRAYTVLLDPPATSKAAIPENAPELGERIKALHTRVRALEAQLADIRKRLALGNERITALWQARRPEQPEGSGSGPEAATKASDAERTSLFGHWFRQSLPWSALASGLTLALLLLLPGWLFRRRRRKHQEEIASPRESLLGRVLPEATPDAVQRGATMFNGDQPSNMEASGHRQVPIRPSQSPGTGFCDILPETPSTAATGLVTGAGAAEWTPVEESATATTVQSLGIPDEFGDPHGKEEETDLISEADLYIAYGRYREAETLLEQALAKSPQHPDIKYKLIEVHYESRNGPRMEALMDQLRKTGDDRADPQQWQRCNAMLEALTAADTQGPRPTTAIGHEENLAPAGAGPKSTPDTWAAGTTDAPDAPGTVWPVRSRTDSPEELPHDPPAGPDTTPGDDIITIPWPKN